MVEKLNFSTSLKNDIEKLELELNKYYEFIINIIKNNKEINKLESYIFYGLNNNENYFISTIYPEIILYNRDYRNSSNKLEFISLNINLKIKIIEGLIEEYNYFIKK